MDPDYKYQIALLSLPEVGAVSAMRLIQYFGSARSALSAPESELTKVERIGVKLASSICKNRKLVDVEKIATRMKNLGVKYFSFTDADYPQLLNKISDAPIGLNVIGNLNLNAPSVAIVGSRNCTVYGRLVARKFAGALARAGFTIVSGMARGIDACAHEAALEVGGKTAAVLGCGVDVIYPSENANLYKKLIEKGAVISEFPVGRPAERQNFPIRNRIVSGMSLAVVVVESDIRGGSMITARTAAEQGRDVFAIPGRIDQDASRGCNALIKDGVRIATCPEDIIESLSFSGQLKIDFSKAECSAKEAEEKAPKAKASDTTLQLDKREAAIILALKKNDTMSADAICAECSLSTQDCITTLTLLEIKKLVSKKGGAYQCNI